MKYTDWLQQSLRKLELMSLLKALIVSILDIGMINDIIDELRRLDFCDVEDADSILQEAS